ncbi:MAG: 7-cyano-7-deazaguanine synthase QueC [Rickettsiales bacterium]|nr:7-cyano-7-deazaguanine synthase QueC [Rickettsiales bacterium]
MKKAIVLLSGGLDSTTVLAIAQNLGFKIYALSFDYGQRHKIELKCAQKIAKKAKVAEHKIAKIDLRIFGNSALTADIEVPKKLSHKKIPVTYVPARNTIFLSFALAYAEVIKAFDIFIGVNAVDFSNYPDCRFEFIQSFEKLAQLATAAGATHLGNFKIHAPLINFSKEEIIKNGLRIGVDYSQTHSCYDPRIVKGKIFACAKCDSCRLRLKGFSEFGIKDPINYINQNDQ